MELPLLDEAIAKLNDHAENRLTTALRVPADFAAAARAAVALGNRQAVASLSSALKNRAENLVNDIDLSAQDFACLVDAATTLQRYKRYN